MVTNKTCFVISPIGATGTPQRKRADTVLRHIFKQALEPLGYSVVRADEISQPGSITLQVLERVLESDLVIADLTDHNPNVFYELAVRHASEKPVIHVISSGQAIPFDVADLRTIKISMDLDGAEQARTEISAQAREVEAGHSGSTPVKLAGVLKHLATGKSDEKVILKQILDGLTEVRADFRKGLSEIESVLGRPKVNESYDSNAFWWALYEGVEKELSAQGDAVVQLNHQRNEDGTLECYVSTSLGRKVTVQSPRSTPVTTFVDAIMKNLTPPTEAGTIKKSTNQAKGSASS